MISSPGMLLAAHRQLEGRIAPTNVFGSQTNINMKSGSGDTGKILPLNRITNKRPLQARTPAQSGTGDVSASVLPFTPLQPSTSMLMGRVAERMLPQHQLNGVYELPPQEFKPVDLGVARVVPEQEMLKFGLYGTNKNSPLTSTFQPQVDVVAQQNFLQPQLYHGRYERSPWYKYDLTTTAGNGSKAGKVVPPIVNSWMSTANSATLAASAHNHSWQNERSMRLAS